MAPNDSPPLHPARVQMIAAFILLAPLTYMGVAIALRLGEVIPEEGYAALPAETLRVLRPALLAAGGLSALASFPVRKAMAARLLGQEPTLANRLRVVIVAMALAESAGVVGLVLFLLTADFIAASILWGCSIGACCLHFPSRAWLESDSNEEHTPLSNGGR